MRQVIVLLNPSTFRAIVSGRRRDLRAHVARAFLSLLSFPYCGIVFLRNRLFDRGWRAVHHVDVPVISIGNITLGGTGKTPTVAWLVQWFSARGIKAAIVSRGYKSDSGKQNDEALELAEKLPGVPHIQNPDRLKAAQTAIAEHQAEAIVLDDGFQHRRLGRNFDLVLIDATEPFGFEKLFPRGTLREPLTNLKRADVVALTRIDSIAAEDRKALWQRIESLAPGACQIEIAYRPVHLMDHNGNTVPLSVLDHARVAAFCGLGNPQNFSQMLSQKNWDLLSLQEYPDHHHYTPHDAQWLKEHCEAMESTAVLCTHKDLVKIGPLWKSALPLYGVIIETKITLGSETLETMLQRYLQQRTSPRSERLG